MSEYLNALYCEAETLRKENRELIKENAKLASDGLVDLERAQKAENLIAETIDYLGPRLQPGSEVGTELLIRLCAFLIRKEHP